VCYTKLAEAWCEKAETVLQITPKLEDIESLLPEAEQFLWAGHEMDHVGIRKIHILELCMNAHLFCGFGR
jgi:hypothetical protein